MEPDRLIGSPVLAFAHLSPEALIDLTSGCNGSFTPSPCLLHKAFLIQVARCSSLPDFTDHLVVEVLYDVEVIEHRLYPGAFFLKSLTEIGVHVVGDGLDRVHPFEADMVDEVIDHLLFLPMGDPEDMAGIKIYDVGGIAVAVVELELINGKHFCRLLRSDQFRAVDGIELLQALKVYGF